MRHYTLQYVSEFQTNNNFKRILIYTREVRTDVE